VSSRGLDSRSSYDGRERDTGSMFVLTIMVSVAIVAAVALALVPFTIHLADRQRAQTAADAAALAGVHGGQTASAELAAANGAMLISWAQTGRSVTVTVMRGDATASARATDEP
jgi:Flp pilus assembly protein TadG